MLDKLCHDAIDEIRGPSRREEREISIIPRKGRVSTRDVREKERREASGMEKECFGIPVAIAWRESFFSQRRETLHIWPAVDRGWTLIV